MVPKKQGESYGYPPKPKRACDMLILSERVNTVDLLKGGMPLAEVGGTMGKMSQASTVFEIKSIN
jgi:hypothetical protein